MTPFILIALFGLWVPPIAWAEVQNEWIRLAHKKAKAVPDKLLKEPTGIAAGSFHVYPQFDLDGIYDDNIFKDTSNTVDDFITELSPGLSIDSDWSRHALRLEAEGDIGLYAENSDENYEDYLLAAAGRFDIGPETNLSGAVQFQNLHDDRGSPDDVRGIEPTDFEVLTGQAELRHARGRFNLRLNGGVQSHDFDDVLASADGIVSTINNDDRDRTASRSGIRFGYQITRDVEIFVQGGYRAVQYDSAIDDNGFDRDSEGFELASGLSILLLPRLSGSVMAGYASRDFDDRNFDTVEEPVIESELTWFADPKTMVRGVVTRSLEETTVNGASILVPTTIRLTVEHALLPDLYLSAEGGWSFNDFKQSDREDRVYDASLGLTYSLGRYVNVNAAYAYRQRDSTAAPADFERNSVLMRITMYY